MRKGVLLKFLVFTLLICVLSNTFVYAQSNTNDGKSDTEHDYIISLGEKYAEDNDIYLPNELSYMYRYGHNSVGWNTVSYYVMNWNGTSNVRLFQLTIETLPNFRVNCGKTKIEIYEYSTLCEYSLDGVIWQSDNTFTDLQRKTQYTVYVRTKANDNFQAGTIQISEVKTK